jgi:magnesium chelatase family protein
MLAKLNAFSLLGIDAVPVEVEVDVAPGQAKTILVGLPELSVRESVHRIERALANLGYQRPTGRTIINLAPADLRKDAGAFDLPIALGMLVATGQVRADQLKDWATVGELALDGAIRPVKGTLSIALAARDRGVKKLLTPEANAREAAVVQELEVYSATSLAEAVGLITGQVDIDPVASDADTFDEARSPYDVDFKDVRGQEFAKRAMVIAASGKHNLLMLWAINRQFDTVGFQSV